MANQAIQDILSSNLEIPESVDNRIEETLLRIKTDDFKVNSKKDNPFKKPIYRKPAALVAAVAIMLLMFSTIALASSESLREFVFGNFLVISVDQGEAYFTETDDGFIVSVNPDDSFGHVNPYSLGDSPFVESFLSFEDFQQSALFIVREPSYLPENLAFKEAGIMLDEDGKFSEAVIITYACDNSDKMLLLNQGYVGTDTHLELEVVDEIVHHGFQSATSFEKVMIGDIEALLAVTTVDGVPDDYISLSWLHDGMAFMISTSDFNADTLIAIAKSM